MKRRLAGLLLLGLIAESGASAAAGEQAEPHLIQATTLQEEWDALVELNLLEVRVETGRGDEVTQADVIKAQEANRPALVRIKAGSLLGSGVIFEVTKENIIIISNRHLLENGETAEVEFANGAQAEGTDLRLSEHYDMGLLCVPCGSMDEEELPGLKRVNWNSECSAQAESGEALFVLGSRDGPGNNLYQGKMNDAWWYSEDFDTYMLYHECSAQQGISGGGTFDAHGHYLGMLTAGNGTAALSLPLVTILQEYLQLAGDLSHYGT